MPSIKMTEVSQPGFDQFGAIPSGGGFEFGGNLSAWTPEALAPHTQGYAQVRRQMDAQQHRRVNEAGRLYADAIRGRIDPVFIREAMRPRNPVLVEHLRQTYPGLFIGPGGRMLGLRETMAQTDYQALYADVIDRLYYASFTAYPIVNKQLVKVADLRDFRAVKRYLYDGLVTPYTGSDPGAPPSQSSLLGPAPQDGAIPPTSATSTAALSYSPLLYQASASINWAAFVGDDLGIFKDVPQRLAVKGNRGIAKFITGQFVDANGPNTTNGLFQAAYHNQLLVANGGTSNNPRLSIPALADGYNIMAGQLDSTGDPIMMGGPVDLVYGSADYATAKNLANMLENFTTQQGGVEGTQQPGQMLRVRNWAMENLTLVYDPYLRLVATNAPYSWLMVLPPNGQNRPAVEVGFLTGFEEPQLFTEIPTTQRMGGGPDPTMGNFWTNNQNIKIMGVMGGTPIDGRSVVGSTGTGHA